MNVFGSDGKSRKPAGDVIILRDVFEKIITWVNNFKMVGDTVVSFDPGHAALPSSLDRPILHSLHFWVCGNHQILQPGGGPTDEWGVPGNFYTDKFPLSRYHAPFTHVGMNGLHMAIYHGHHAVIDTLSDRRRRFRRLP